MKKCCKLLFVKHINSELCREDFLWVVKELRKSENDNPNLEPEPEDLNLNWSSSIVSLSDNNNARICDKLGDASLLKNPEILIVQNVYHFTHFVYIACTLSSASGWQRYQELFARWLNSGSGMNAIVNHYF